MSNGDWSPAWLRNLRASIGLLALFGALSSLETSAVPSAIERRIDRISNGLLPAVRVKGESLKVTPLAARMEALHVPGISVGVIHNGKLEWARGFGVTSLGGPPVTPDTLFQAASISKPVSAVAVMHLVQTGKLNLDTDINQILKTWTLPANDFTREAHVTLRGLLTHSAGVMAHGFAGYEAGAPLPSVVQILNGEPPATNPAIRVDTLPGKTWRYSNGGYVIAQQAVTDATGTAFPQLMQQLVLRPFGMKHSTYEQPLPPKLLATAAMPYWANGSAVTGGPHVYPELAAASLWTTPSDLARFAIGMQQALAGKSRRVLSAETARAMLVPAFNKQAIAFVVGGRTERKYFSHGGITAGYRCLMVAYQDGDGAVIMTNSDSGEALLQELTRTIAHEYGWPDLAPPDRVLNAVDPKSFDRYVGAYRFQNGRIFTFWREGTQIRSRISGQSAVDLFPTAANEYFARIVDARVKFSAGSVVLLQNDIEQTVQRLDDAAGRAAFDWSLATEKRIRETTTAPGSEAALRSWIAGLASNTPPYDNMSAGFAQVVRQQLATLHGTVIKFGALEALTFKRVAASGWDFYEAKFANATHEFGILMQEDGKIFGAQFDP